MECIRYLLNLLLSKNIEISLTILNNNEFYNTLVTTLTKFYKEYNKTNIDFKDPNMDINKAESLSKYYLKELFENYDEFNVDKYINNLKIIESNTFDAGFNYDRIFISDDHNLLTVPAIAHECTHYIVLQYMNLTEFKSEYFEMFSMLIDKIVSYKMGDKYYKANKIFRQKDLYKKTEIFLRSDKLNIDETNKFLIKVFALQTIIGDIYSTLLFNEYLKNPKAFINNLNRLLKQHNPINITEYLSSYQIENNKDKISLLLK